ncbi:MAG: transposase [Actinomycetota bacterium]|nr:transposase [Actinomycetota bacterium]
MVPDTKRSTLHGHIGAHVEPGSTIYTDVHRGYNGLDGTYAHETVDHAERYVDGRAHTNGLENFWSLLKRAA